MGTFPSCLPRYSCCVPKKNPTSTYGNHVAHSAPKPLKHKRNLSAAFNMLELDTDRLLPQVNINICTEEELMTLPGINRLVAQNIVQYRAQINGFKRVEDVALVSGVGAAHFNEIKNEICVNNIKVTSAHSSLDSSHLDISALFDNLSRASGRSQKSSLVQSININTANVFQLMKIKGLSQQLAENIVMYRDKKGLFRYVDDLIRVKGITAAMIRTFKPYMTLVDDSDSACLANNNALNHAVEQNSLSTQSHDLNHVTPPNSSLSHDQNHLAPPQFTQSHDQTSLHPADSQEDLCSLYGPLGRRSTRLRKRKVNRSFNGRSVVRIATWNLCNCDESKATNPGVKEVVAMTILENGFDIIAFQDLLGSEPLSLLCNELNTPTIPNIKKWPGGRGVWRCVVSEPLNSKCKRVGFLYNSSEGIVVKSCSPLTVEYGFVHSLGCCFQCPGYDVSVANVILYSGEKSDISPVFDYLSSSKGGVLTASFVNVPDVPEPCTSALYTDQCTNISLNQPEGSMLLDNIWINGPIRVAYTGRGGVIHDELCSPWIPNGWGWGGLVSDHCPVWAELYSDKLAPEVGGGDMLMTLGS